MTADGTCVVRWLAIPFLFLLLSRSSNSPLASFTTSLAGPFPPLDFVGAGSFSFGFEALPFGAGFFGAGFALFFGGGAFEEVLLSSVSESFILLGIFFFFVCWGGLCEGERSR